MAARRPDDPPDRSDADAYDDHVLTIFVATCLEYAWNQSRPITEDDIVNLAKEHLQVPTKASSRLQPLGTDVVKMLGTDVLKMLEGNGWGKSSSKGWEVLRNEENKQRSADVHRILGSRPDPTAARETSNARRVRAFNADLQRAFSRRNEDQINTAGGARKGPLELQASTAEESSETVSLTNSEMPPANSAAGQAPPVSDTELHLPLNHIETPHETPESLTMPPPALSTNTGNPLAQFPKVDDLDKPTSAGFQALQALCLMWAWEYERPITKAAVADFVKGGIEPENAKIPDAILKKSVALLLAHLDRIGVTVPGPQGRDIVRNEATNRLVGENSTKLWAATRQKVIEAGRKALNVNGFPTQNPLGTRAPQEHAAAQIPTLPGENELSSNLQRYQQFRLRSFFLSWAWDQANPFSRGTAINLLTANMTANGITYSGMEHTVARILDDCETAGLLLAGPDGRQIDRSDDVWHGLNLVADSSMAVVGAKHFNEAYLRLGDYTSNRVVAWALGVPVTPSAPAQGITEEAASLNQPAAELMPILQIPEVHPEDVLLYQSIFCNIAIWAYRQDALMTARLLAERLTEVGVSSRAAKALASVAFDQMSAQKFFIGGSQEPTVNRNDANARLYAAMKSFIDRNGRPTIGSLAKRLTPQKLADTKPFAAVVRDVFAWAAGDRYLQVTVMGIDSGDGRRDSTVESTYPSGATLSDVRRALLQKDFGTPYRFYSVQLKRIVEPESESVTSVSDIGPTLELRRVDGAAKGKKQKAVAAQQAAANSKCRHPSEACVKLDAVLESLRTFALTKGRLKSSDIGQAMALLGENVDMFFQGKVQGSHDAHDLVTHEVYRRLGAVVDRVEAELQLDAVLQVGSLVPLFQAIARASVRIDVADIEMNRHIGSVFERVARFILRLCENPFKAPPEFISSLGGALLELTKGRADFFVWVATYRGLLTSVDMLLEASSVRQPELLVFAASVTVFTDWVEIPSARPDLHRLAIWCIRSVACFTESPMEFIPTRSGNTYYGQIIIDHLVNSYCQHLLLYSDVDPAHLAYLPDLLDAMIATTPDSGIEIQFPVILLKMADLSNRNPENGEFPGAHHDRLCRVLSALDAYNGNSTLRFAYSMDSLCKRVGFRRRLSGIESTIVTRALDSIVDNKEFTTFALDETCGTLPRRLSWLLDMTASAAVRYHKYYRALFQVLLVMQEHIPEDFDLITTRSDVWPSMMNILEGSSDYCPHSSLSLSVWRILALLSAYQGGSQVIVNCRLHEYTSVVADYIMNRYEPAFPDTPTGRSPNDVDEDDDGRYPNDAENRDFAELASLIGDVTISVLGYFPEVASSFRSESMSELFDQGGDEDFNACYGSVLLQYSNPHDVASWSEQPRMLYLVREIYDTVKMETDFPSNAHICFSLWNFLRCVHANGRKEVKVGTTEKSITDIQLQFLKQLAANTKVDPLIRETAEDALVMAREAGFM